MSVLPDFVEPYHQAAVEVKGGVVQDAEHGQSIPHIAEQSSHFAGGPYTEKTLRRWLRTWRQRFLRHQDRLWALLLHTGLDMELPREHTSDILALSSAWNSGLNRMCLFSALLRLDRSTNMAVNPIHPTEAGHSRYE